jgi:hypothetical protein
LAWFETSSKESINIEKPFNVLVNRILKLSQEMKIENVKNDKIQIKDGTKILDQNSNNNYNFDNKQNLSYYQQCCYNN